MSVYRKEKAGRFGTHPVALQGVVFTVTANTTTKVQVGSYPVPASLAPTYNIFVAVAPVDADGTLVGTLYKYDASANAAVALSASTDLITLVAQEARTVSLLGTLTAAQMVLDAGDTVYFEITSDSAAIDTAPGAVVVTAEAFVLE